MPKNSRPDVQVLEDRIARIKEQITEFTELRLYQPTRNKLSVLTGELEECLLMLNSIEQRSSASPERKVSDTLSLLSLDADDADSSEEEDLQDNLLLFRTNSPSSKNISTYSPKEILKQYGLRIQRCADLINQEGTGIIQVNQFSAVLNMWYQTRFPVVNKDPNFFFKSDKIYQWVNLLIIAAGYSMSTGQFSEFLQEMNQWSEALGTTREKTWVLPYTVMKLKNCSLGYYTKEAVLIEKIIKPLIYDKDFYPQEINSIECVVIAGDLYPLSDLTVEQITKSCKEIISTSSFDPKKFEREVANV